MNLKTLEEQILGKEGLINKEESEIPNFFFLNLSDILKKEGQEKEKKISLLYINEENKRSNLYVIKPECNVKIRKRELSNAYNQLGCKSLTLRVIEKIINEKKMTGDKIRYSIGGRDIHNSLSKLRIYGVLTQSNILTCPILKIKEREKNKLDNFCNYR